MRKIRQYLGRLGAWLSSGGDDTQRMIEDRRAEAIRTEPRSAPPSQWGGSI